MFSIRRNCTKIIKVGEILGISSSRAFSSKSKFPVNLMLEKHIWPNRDCRKGYSSSVDTSAGDVEKEINFDSITNGDKDLEHKLKVLVLEAEVMRQEGKGVPPNSFLTEEHWKELLNFPSRSGRRRYLEFLFKVSKKKENRQAKKLEKKLLWDCKKEALPEKKTCESIEEFAMQYDLQHNNLFLRFYDTTINQMYNNRLIQAMMFGQKLIVDCGYEANMTKRENLFCAKQLMLLFAENRAHDDPFDLHYCNANMDGKIIKELSKFIPSLFEPSFPLNVHESSYLDMFPRDQLVYLTPHCREEINEFDHDAVYIIGGIVDKVNNEPLSLAKAKKEGLKMAKFPLDRYLQWGAGSGKSLTLNQVASILNDVKVTGNWEHALRHVPRRKLADYNIGSNINKATDNLRYDRSKKQRKWVPASNVDIGNLSYNRHDDNRVKDTERTVNIKSIMND